MDTKSSPPTQQQVDEIAPEERMTSNFFLYLFLILAILAHLLDPVQTFVTIELILISTYIFLRVSSKILGQVRYYYNSVPKFNKLVINVMKELGIYLVFAILIFVAYGDFAENWLYILEVTLFFLTTSFYMANLSFQFSVENINYNRTEENNMLFNSTNANIKGLVMPIGISFVLALISILFLEPSFGFNNIALWLSDVIINSLFVITGSLGYLKYRANIEYVQNFEKESEKTVN